MHQSQLDKSVDSKVLQDNLLVVSLVVSIAKQTLTLCQLPEDFDQSEIVSSNDLDGVSAIKVFKVSTAKNGINNMEGTGGTPLGHHIIADKIGTTMPINSVFVGRVPTGEIYSDTLGQQNPTKDWILSRILWLKGCEDGVNLGKNKKGCCDTYERYIYIHGTPDTELMGEPLSHGCIRMRNNDIVWLFEQVKEGTSVHILEE